MRRHHPRLEGRRTCAAGQERAEHPRRTTAIDTTGAGDTFVGTFAAEVATGATYEAAVRRATVAASLSVEQQGAVPSIPTRKAVDDVLQLERVENG